MNLHETHLGELFHAPVPAKQQLPAVVDFPPALTDDLIRLLATSYVRREGRFFHIDRPSVSLTRDDLQRSFLYQAQRANHGAPVPNAIMKEVFDAAIFKNNPDPWVVRLNQLLDVFVGHGLVALGLALGL